MRELAITYPRSRYCFFCFENVNIFKRTFNSFIFNFKELFHHKRKLSFGHFLFIHVLPSYFFSTTIIADLNCALNPFSTQPTGNRNGFITQKNLFTVNFAVITAATLSAGRFLPDCKPSTIFVAVPFKFVTCKYNLRPSGKKKIFGPR